MAIKKKVNKANAEWYRIHFLEPNNLAPAVDPALAVDPAVAVAGAVDSDTSKETDTAPIGAVASFNDITTNASPSSPEGAGNPSPLAVQTAAPSSNVITVPYRKYRANCMIQTAAFDDGKSSTKLKLQLLMESLAGIAIPLRTPSVQYMLVEDKSSVPFFVFEIGDSAGLALLLTKGIESADGTEMWPFLPLSVEKQKAEERRSIDIRSLQYDTEAHQIRAAMAKFGPVEHVKMGFNLIKSMATARVTFSTEDAVTGMIARKITCISVGQDTGLIARLGETRPDFNPDLTLKLTHLPRGCTPCDVVEALADLSYFGITMPLDPKTRRRRTEAYVYFSNAEEQRSAREQDYQLRKSERITTWAELKANVYDSCGAVGHKSKKCDISLQEASIRQRCIRNVDLISPNNRPQTVSAQQSARPPTSKAQVSAAKGKGEAASHPASVCTTGKANALFSTATTLASAAAGPSEAAHIRTHAATAVKASTAGRSSSPQPPVAWNTADDAMLQQALQANVCLDKEFEEQQQQMESLFKRIDSRLDRMERMLQAYGTQSVAARQLPTTQESVSKIADIGQDADLSEAELLKLLAQERMQRESERAAWQQELASVRNIVEEQHALIQRNIEFAEQQSARASQLSHVRSAPVSQQGISPMPDAHGNHSLQQTVSWSAPNGPPPFLTVRCSGSSSHQSTEIKLLCSHVCKPVDSGNSHIK
ncbi:hypothetical protein EC968_002424 [Mortierella alpina]|nr:hypothetical protein EC968_002424 [Mortierella alpina]